MTNALPKTMIVTGATGRQGSAVIDTLLAADDDGSEPFFKILAVTREITFHDRDVILTRSSTRPPRTTTHCGVSLNSRPNLYPGGHHNVAMTPAGSRIDTAGSRSHLRRSCRLPHAYRALFYRLGGEVLREGQSGGHIWWFGEEGYCGDVSQCKKAFPGLSDLVGEMQSIRAEVVGR